MTPALSRLEELLATEGTTAEETVRLDLHYVENWSPVQDFVILLRTVKAVVAKEGAH